MFIPLPETQLFHRPDIWTNKSASFGFCVGEREHKKRKKTKPAVEDWVFTLPLKSAAWSHGLKNDSN